MTEVKKNDLTMTKQSIPVPEEDGMLLMTPMRCGNDAMSSKTENFSPQNKISPLGCGSKKKECTKEPLLENFQGLLKFFTTKSPPFRQKTRLSCAEIHVDLTMENSCPERVGILEI